MQTTKYVFLTLLLTLFIASDTFANIPTTGYVEQIVNELKKDLTEYGDNDKNKALITDDKGNVTAGKITAEKTEGIIGHIPFGDEESTTLVKIWVE